MSCSYHGNRKRSRVLVTTVATGKGGVVVTLATSKEKHSYVIGNDQLIQELYLTVQVKLARFCLDSSLLLSCTVQRILCSSFPEARFLINVTSDPRDVGYL